MRTRIVIALVCAIAVGDGARVRRERIVQAVEGLGRVAHAPVLLAKDPQNSRLLVELTQIEEEIQQNCSDQSRSYVDHIEQIQQQIDQDNSDFNLLNSKIEDAQNALSNANQTLADL